MTMRCASDARDSVAASLAALDPDGIRAGSVVGRRCIVAATGSGTLANDVLLRLTWMRTLR
jgi:hypothetical protein